RDEDHRQAGQLVLREREERDRRREQDEDPAGGRRPLLRHVRSGPLLADLLAELLAPQELDEARPGDDREDAGHDAGDEDSGHAATCTLASASAIRSRPSTRAPLSRTQSPGRSSARSTSSASSAFAVQRPP